MKTFINFLKHLFWPHEKNNHRARLLHHSGLVSILLIFLFFQAILSFYPKLNPRVLGYASNISTSEVIRLTNEKRSASGLSPLQINSTLSQAALAKGNDMIAKGYWAHASPDGTEPWKFFKDWGYKYKFAGENLARDFTNPSAAVDAWMASTTHKENLLSPKYREIGVAVVEGKLSGVDTTIIVQFFGTKAVDTIPIQQIAVNIPLPSPQVVNQTQGITTANTVLISPFNTTKGLSLLLVLVLLVVLVIDGIVATRGKIARVTGRTFAHISFLGMILAIVLIAKAGQVL